MKKLLKKKVNMFGKEVSVLLVALVAMSVVSAALLGYYGIITGMAVVSQSVVLDNDGTVTGAWEGTFVAGKTIVDCDNDEDGYSVKNNADVVALIQFGTTCRNTTGQDDGEKTTTSIDWASECEGIDTEIYGILELENKDGNWNVIDQDNIRATLYYSVVGEKFGYDLEATGLTPSIDYSLIYYADKPDRFVEWGGNNPGALIVTTSSDGSGNLVTNGDVDLGMNLPSPNDANIDEYIYCTATKNDATGETGDNFEHCHGAKIWLVKTNDLPAIYPSNNPWAFWNSAGILYETDLIVYSDDNVDNEITLPANGGGFNFCVENDFALNLVPDIALLKSF